ncbi:MAG: SDR family oxidoreductase [Microthrixaceae bacterium]|nr:SDR family oxidoreductase [Microthrixaceae bacterium]
MSLPLAQPDRIALITGASSGIGAELARELAERGQNVALVARSTDKLVDLAQELQGLGVRAEVLQTDLSNRSERAALPGRIDELGLWVSILVNNAGLSTMGRVHHADPDAEMNMIEVDVMAVADLCTRFLPTMVEKRSGAVLNVASTAAFQPIPGQAGYAASKSFVLSYTHALAGELRGTNVTATALCPGPVRTGFGDAAGISQQDAESALPRFMWEPAPAVARCGVDAMAAGRTVAIPGVANQVTAFFGDHIPRRLLMPLMASKHPGMRRD